MMVITNKKGNQKFDCLLTKLFNPFYFENVVSS